MLCIRGRIRPRNPDVGASTKVNAADGVDRERNNMVEIPLHQPFESVPHADHVYAFECGANGCSTDHRVDTGGGSSPNQDRQLLMMFHLFIIGRPARKALWFSILMSLL